MGLVSRLTAPADLLSTARQMAREVAEAGPVALAVAKKVMQARDLKGDAVRASERAYLSELMASSEPEEGLNAFLEKRKPAWNKG